MTEASPCLASLPAALVLSTIELKVLKKILVRKNKEIDISTLKGATRAIATLGGYLNRNNDPDPGPIVIWRGYAKLQDALVFAGELQS